MEVFLFLILGVIGIAAFILPWINLFRHNAAHQDDWRLRRRIEVLETQIHDLLAEKDSISPPASTIGDEVQETSVSQPCEALKTEISEQILQEEDVPEAQPVGYEYFDEEQEDEYIEKSSVTASLPPSAAVHTPSPKKSAEFNFATRLSVWIGSVSLAFAAFFLVKLSYDAGLLGPETRIILGMLFGGGLVASSLFLSKNQKIPNALRISQGLAGAGLVSLCFSLYSAANIHHFISSMAGFTGMVAVVGATLVLSLRLGAPVALFGMIGGFVTPILFSTSEPNVTGLLGYLFVLFTSIQFLGSRRNWSAISYLSLIGVVLWVVSLLVWGHDRGFLDPSILSLFLLGICASSFAVHLFQSREIDDCAIHKASNASRLPAITIGVSSFLLLATQGTFGFGLFEWGITLVISLAIVALSVLRPKLYGSAVWVKFAIDAVTYGFYTDSVLYDQGSALVILSSLFVIYAVLPALIMAKMQVRPKYWSLVQVVSSLTLFLIARADFGSLSDMSPFAPWGVLAIGLSLFCLVQARLWVSRSHEDATSIIAYYALGCTSFLSLGMALILDEVYLPLAFAAEFAAVIGIHRKMQLNILPKIAYALLALVLVLSAEGLGDGISIMLSGITDKTIYL
ncbi:MAG TPA: DUF2339 domain-containing protein [Alphaproteobacteria bacterium]|nr:DUF2339 domain-containing protein [Alphaproteobacteria bacterium]